MVVRRAQTGSTRLHEFFGADCRDAAQHLTQAASTDHFLAASETGEPYVVEGFKVEQSLDSEHPLEIQRQHQASSALLELCALKYALRNTIDAYGHVYQEEGASVAACAQKRGPCS